MRSTQPRREPGRPTTRVLGSLGTSANLVTSRLLVGTCEGRHDSDSRGGVPGALAASPYTHEEGPAAPGRKALSCHRPRVGAWELAEGERDADARGRLLTTGNDRRRGGSGVLRLERERDRLRADLGERGDLAERATGRAGEHLRALAGVGDGIGERLAVQTIGVARAHARAVDLVRAGVGRSVDERACAPDADAG